MSWQKCPICDGAGHVGIGFPTGAICSVCQGQKIIHSVTGQVPYKIVTTTGVLLDKPGTGEPVRGKVEE